MLRAAGLARCSWSVSATHTCSSRHNTQSTSSSCAMRPSPHQPPAGLGTWHSSCLTAAASAAASRRSQAPAATVAVKLLPAKALLLTPGAGNSADRHDRSSGCRLGLSCARGDSWDRTNASAAAGLLPQGLPAKPETPVSRSTAAASACQPLARSRCRKWQRRTRKTASGCACTKPQLTASSCSSTWRSIGKGKRGSQNSCAGLAYGSQSLCTAPCEPWLWHQLRYTCHIQLTTPTQPWKASHSFYTIALSTPFPKQHDAGSEGATLPPQTGLAPGAPEVS